MRHLNILPLFISTAVSLVAVAGCSIGKIDTSQVRIDSSTAPTAPIRYNSDRSIDTPIATGSSSTITVDLPEGTVIASASTGDPTIATVDAIRGSGSSVSFPVYAKSAGSTPFIVHNDHGVEVGRAMIHVADTKEIQFDGPEGLTLASGASYTVHATTMGDDGVVLVGDGAIAFEASGSLVEPGSAGSFCLGDCGSFHTNGVGDGYLHVVAKGASADRTFHVVDRASIDTIAFNTIDVHAGRANGTVLVFTLFAGTTPVVPGDTASCASADPSVVTIDFAGSLQPLGNDSTGQVLLSGHAPGATTVTCTVGSHSATARVTVP